MYQEPTALDAENFANFSFAQPAEDINQPLPLPENLLQPAPASDHRAATELMNTTHQLMDDLQKLMEQLTVIHNLLYHSLCCQLYLCLSCPPLLLLNALVWMGLIL